MRHFAERVGKPALVHAALKPRRLQRGVSQRVSVLFPGFTQQRNCFRRVDLADISHFYEVLFRACEFFFHGFSFCFACRPGLLSPAGVSVCLVP